MRIVRDNEEKGSVFDKHFRELRNTEAKPSGDLWDRVEYRLDEDREKAKHDHWYYAILALLIPLTAVNIYLTYDLKGLYVSFLDKTGIEQVISDADRQQNTHYLPSQFISTGGASVPMENGITEGTRNTLVSATENLLAGNEIEIPEQMVAGFSAAPATQGGSNGNNNGNRSNAVNGEENSVDTQDGEVPLDGIPAERLKYETDATPQDVQIAFARNLRERKGSAIRGFHVGVEGGVHNSMILIRENTLEPLVSKDMNRKADVNGYYAVSLGYDFSRKFGMETELIFRSMQGQKYSELRYGKIPIDGEIDLTYLHVPLLFKYKMSKMGGRSLNPRVINFVAGFQYSRLQDARVKINNLDLENAMEPFNRDELGIVLGLEYDLFISPNYFFTFGTRASISSDIRAFPFFTPQASQTYNVLFGANVSFHYLMKRK